MKKGVTTGANSNERNLSVPIIRYLIYLGLFYFLLVCMFVYTCHMSVGALGGQKRTSDLLERELRAVVSCLSAGTKLQASRGFSTTEPALQLQ